MILMPVIAVMGEHDVRIKLRLDLLKPFLDYWPLARKVTLAKRSDLDLFVRNAAQEVLCASIRLFRARSWGAEYDPADLQLRNLPDQLQQGSAGSDFDIIRMRTKAKNATC